MKLKVLSVAKTEKGTMDLPSQFHETIRPDVIYRAVLAIYSNKRQPYGTDPRAGKKSMAKLSRRRRNWKGSYGHGISRVPRKIVSRSGTQFNWIGAFAPMTVGGMRAHPPKSWKSWKMKVNKKENRKAIRSAMAATLSKELVKSKGHEVPENYPFIIESKIEKISKTAELVDTLKKLGFENELERATRKIRAGMGKARGRKYKTTRGMLIVVSQPCELQNAAENLTGVEVAEIKKINAEILAPGASAGRMTIFTESAIEMLAKEKLFTGEIKIKKEEKPEIKKQEEPKAIAKPKPKVKVAKK